MTGRGEITAEFAELLRRDGVLRGADAKLTALTDGVSSEILRVEDGGDAFVVKRALAKLNVRDEWLADVDRNKYEQRYIEYVAGFLPDAVPAMRAGPEDRGYFAMELLGAEFVSWKRMLLRGDVQLGHAVKAAGILGAIHARSAGDAEVAARFATTENFVQLRVDPYLLTTGRRHADLRERFEAEAERLAGTRQCLVHGDFSPKNMMISPERFVLLDCEVAWYGDAAFDVAFLLTHLFLKGLFHAPREMGLRSMSEAFWRRYVETAGARIDCAVLEPRVARLLAMLMLARVDGKSPVEYLSAEQQERVRRFARKAIQEECEGLSEMAERWFGELRNVEARA